MKTILLLLFREIRSKTVAATAIAVGLPQLVFGQPTENPGAPSDQAPPSGPSPKITVVRLTQIRSVYEKIRDDLQCRATFNVSRDGEHCASVQRLGLASWTVQIDGQTGPESTAAISKIYPNHDFSEVFYQAQDASSKQILVIQKHDGTAKTYPIPQQGAKNVGSWTLDLPASLKFRHLIRYRDVTPVNPLIVNGTSAFQVDENGPVIGPLGSASFEFDESYRHFLLTGRVLVGADSALTVLFFDGNPACQSFFTPSRSKTPKVDVVEFKRFLNDDGAYWVRIGPFGSLDRKDVLNGNKLFVDRNGHWPMPVFSPDGHCAARVLPNDRGNGVYLDDQLINTLPAGIFIDKLQFTDDGHGLIYTASSGPMTSVYADAQAVLNISAGRVSDLWPGPRKGQYACVAMDHGKKELVINGQHLPFAGTGESCLGFSADGTHVLGREALAKDMIFFADNTLATAELDGKPVHAGTLLKPIITASGCKIVDIEKGQFLLVKVESPFSESNKMAGR